MVAGVDRFAAGIGASRNACRAHNVFQRNPRELGKRSRPRGCAADSGSRDAMGMTWGLRRRSSPSAERRGSDVRVCNPSEVNVNRTSCPGFGHGGRPPDA